MNSRVRRLRLGTWYAVGLLLLEAAVACSGDDDDNGAGGSSGTSTAGKSSGGSSGKGGTGGAKGGTAGKVGGNGGAGGSGATAGGGTTSVGGTGAVAATGGSAAVGGTDMMMNPNCTLKYEYNGNTGDSSLPYSEPSSLADDSELDQTSTEGAGTPGALEVTIPFTDQDQLLRVTLTPYEYSLKGLTLMARVKLGKGITSDTDHPGHARISVISGLDSVYARGGDVDLVKGEWLTLRFDPLDPAFVEDQDKYDPVSIYEIDVEITSGHAADSKYTTATVYIDDLAVCTSMNTSMGGNSGIGGGPTAGTGGTGPGGEGGTSADAGNGNASGVGGEGGA